MCWVDIVLLCGVLVVATADAGVISGSVRLKGKKPTVAVQYAEDGNCGPSEHPLQSLVLGTNQAVRDVIVYISPGTQNGKPDTNAVLDQQLCEFVPRVQIARSGGQLVLKNSDPVLHVVQIE